MEKEETDSFHFKAFCNLDDSPDADFLIHSMDVMSSLPCIQWIKNQAIDSMLLKKGDRILEVGCGQGADTEKIAEKITPGVVTAIDLSQRMISEAKKRTQFPNVIYQVADIFQLEHQAYFSACYADRLLVSHADYQDIFSKIMQLVKPKGKICITDVDALSIMILPYNSVTQLIISQILKAFVNPDMGKKLPALFYGNNLKNIHIRKNISSIKDFSVLSQIFQFPVILKELINEEIITQQQASDWVKIAHEASRNGTFLYTVTFSTAIGEI